VQRGKTIGKETATIDISEYERKYRKRGKGYVHESQILVALKASLSQGEEGEPSTKLVHKKTFGGTSEARVRLDRGG